MIDRGPSVEGGTHGSNRRQVWTIVSVLAREEWRLHARLFGGVRFLSIPAVIGGFAVVTAALVAKSGASIDHLTVGLHVFALGFGLYAGTAGFAGSDMLEDVFGSHSFVLSTTRTLPISRRLFLGLFLAKDAALYGFLFVLPMSLAIVGFVGIAPGSFRLVVGGWLSLWVVFVLGMALTASTIALRTRGVPAWVLVASVLVLVSGLWSTIGPLESVDLLVAVGDPLTGAVVAGGAVTIGVVSLWLYDPTHTPPARTPASRYDRPLGRLADRDALVAKSIRDLGRSSGGFAKPFVSVGILFLLVAGFVGVVEAITGRGPSPGIFFGGVLALSAFTTYNWLTQFDDVDDYLILPVSVGDVFRAKRLAFVLVGVPTVVVAYAVSLAVFEVALGDAIAGLPVLIGYSLYYYGLTVSLAGFSPNEFLFDGVRFGAFGLGVALVLVPTLVVAFAVEPSTLVVSGFFVWSVILAGVGVVLSNRAAATWEVRRRAGVVR